MHPTWEKANSISGNFVQNIKTNSVKFVNRFEDLIKKKIEELDGFYPESQF